MVAGGSVLQVRLPSLSEGSAEALGELLVRQRQAARDADWDALRLSSLTLLGAGRGHGSVVRAVRRSDAAQAESAAVFAGELFDGLSQLAARSDHAAQAQGIRDTLASTHPQLAARAGPLLDQVASGTIEVGPFDEGQAAAAVLGQAPATALDADLCVAAVTRGLVGMVHWVMNTGDARAPVLAQFEDELGGLWQARADAGEAISAGEVGLHAACSGGQREDVAAAARALGDIVEQMLFPLAALQPVGRSWVAALRAAGRNGDAEQVGHELALHNLLIRRAVADAAVATMLDLDLALRQLPEPVTALLDTGGVGFDVGLPDGRNTTLAQLGPGDEGVFVQVEGFVTDLEAVREPDGKLVGRLGLLDPSSGATAEVATVFLHPGHIGITVGCYVIVHGLYRESSARLEGRPGVETDALAPAALSGQSWQARLWFTAGRWIDVWRSDLNLSWSLGTHTAGPDDSDDPTRGASELIFAPFARPTT